MKENTKDFLLIGLFILMVIALAGLCVFCIEMTMREKNNPNSTQATEESSSKSSSLNKFRERMIAEGIPSEDYPLINETVLQYNTAKLDVEDVQIAVWPVDNEKENLEILTHYHSCYYAGTMSHEKDHGCYFIHNDEITSAFFLSQLNGSLPQYMVMINEASFGIPSDIRTGLTVHIEKFQ